MKLIIFLIVLFSTKVASPQSTLTFKVIPLGVLGGIDESNLSAYLLAPIASQEYICLDAGTINVGIQKAIRKKIFKVPVDTVLKKYVKGYLISHAHLDHVSGLIINSPDDIGPKNIYGLQYTLNVLRDNYFTWRNWANFGNDGEKPFLNKYHYTPLELRKITPIVNTSMTVEAFALSHGNPYESTAFLINHNGNYILYLGDVGADEIEKSDKLNVLWRAITPLIKSKQLKAMMIEVSYRNQQPDNSLFGHLTPYLLMKEMNNLSLLTGTEALKNFPVVVTHIKPTGQHKKEIVKQLRDANKLKLKLIIPEQARLMEF